MCGFLSNVRLSNRDNQPSFPISVAIDKSTCEQLMNDHTTALIQATRRLIKTKINRAIKGRLTDKHRWAASIEQEYFRITNGWSSKILIKCLGKGPA